MAEIGTNKTAKLIKSLKEKKYRDRDWLFVVEGERFVGEIMDNCEIEFMVFSESYAALKDVSEYKKAFVFSDKIFKEFSETSNPQGIIAVCRKKTFSIDEVIEKNAGGIYILAEDLNDPGNLGTIIRTADASGAAAVILSKGSVDLYNGKVLRSTMGSLFHIPVIENADIKQCIEKLKKSGITVFAAHLKGDRTLYDCNFKNPSAFVIGNEARGLSDETSKICDVLLKIPMPGKAESLNAAVAASVMMYEAVGQRMC